MTDFNELAKPHLEALSEEGLSQKAALAIAALRRIVEEQSRIITKQTRSIEEANNRASTDALTGLYNRGAFDHDLKRLTDRLSASHTHREIEPYDQFKWMLILGDLDYFKLVNDVLGYEFGDATLISVARLLEKSTRHDDKIYRLGGDEFAAIIPVIQGKESNAFRAITGRFHRYLDELRENGGESPEHEALQAVGISFAYGIFTDTPSSTEDLTFTVAETMRRVKGIKEAKGTDLR